MPLHLVMPDILADDITDELLKIIYRLHRFISAEADDDSIVMVESPYGIETEFNPFDPRCVDQNVDYKKFSEVEIRKAAEMPYSRIGGASRDRLLTALVKGGIPQWDVERVVLKLWSDKQVEPDAIMPNLDFLQYVRDKRVDEILSLIQTYLNKIPYWRFKGWSSEKMASRQRESKDGGMPVIMPGPGFQAMGINTPEQMMALLDNEEGLPQFGGFPFAQGNRKIGRNDPCPCGSGKKYKNCCGKKIQLINGVFAKDYNAA